MLPTGRPPGDTESDRVYRVLRDEILRGVLAPGEPLLEVELMDRLACGRTPLREAVRLLVTDGLVEVATRRGTYVTQVDIQDCEMLVDLRIAVERLLASSVVRYATPRQIAGLGEFIGAVEAGDSDVDDLDFDAGFHDRILAMSANRYITAVYWRLVGESMRLLQAVNAPLEPVDQLLPEFRAAHQAIIARDSTALEAALISHINSFVRGFDRGLSLMPGAVRATAPDGPDTSWARSERRSIPV